MSEKGVVVVISGFSGTGKGTVIKQLMEKYSQYVFSISATTRLPRAGETHGKEYFFLSKEEFEKKIKENLFLEHASYVDNYYGTPRDYVEEKLNEGKDVVLDIEVQGALNVKKAFPEAILIYILPPSAEELKKRLMGRGTETEEVIRGRMNRSLEESRLISEYDYVVVNDRVMDCVEKIHGIVSSEHSRVKNNREFINDISSELMTYLKGEK